MRGPSAVSQVERGTEMLGFVSVTDNTAIGSVLFQFDVSPRAIEGSRLSAMSFLWEKYRFRKLRIRYEPMVSANTDGQIVMYFDKDPADPLPTTGVPALRNALSTAGSRSSPVYQSMTVEHLSEAKSILFTDPSASLTVTSRELNRFTEVGDLIILSASVLASRVYGTVYMDYEIEWFDPQISESIDFGGGGCMLMQNGSATQTEPLGTTAVPEKWSKTIDQVYGYAMNAFRLKRGVYQLLAQINGVTDGHPVLATVAQPPIADAKFYDANVWQKVGAMPALTSNFQTTAIIVATSQCDLVMTDSVNGMGAYNSLKILKISDDFATYASANLVGYPCAPYNVKFRNKNIRWFEPVQPTLPLSERVPCWEARSFSGDVGESGEEKKASRGSTPPALSTDSHESAVPMIRVEESDSPVVVSNQTLPAPVSMARSSSVMRPKTAEKSK